MDRAPVANDARSNGALQNESETALTPTPDARTELPVVVLPSGSTLTVRAGAGGEEILLRSARGSMSLHLRVTDDGPVLTLHGVRLEIEAADSVAVNCREFEVHASDAVRLTAGDVSVRSDTEIHMRSGGQTYIDGDFVNLNCLDRTGYHDFVPESPAALPPSENTAASENPDA